MMDNDDAWMYYHDEVVEQIDLNVILKTAESVCSALGFKLGKTWEAYVTELPKLPWTSIYLTSLELEDYGPDNGKRRRIVHEVMHVTEFLYICYLDTIS